jgi:hypothetical protein
LWILLFALSLAAIARLFSAGNYRLKTDNPIQPSKRTEEIKAKEEKIKLDINELRKPISFPSSLAKRSPFFRVRVPALKVAPGEPMRKEEILIPTTEVKKIEPFSYKGKGKIKGRAVVFIEDNWTRKVYFVGKGDILGDYKVLDITEEEVVLFKEDREIRLTTKPKEGPLKE